LNDITENIYEEILHVPLIIKDYRYPEKVMRRMGQPFIMDARVGVYDGLKFRIISSDICYRSSGIESNHIWGGQITPKAGFDSGKAPLWFYTPTGQVFTNYAFDDCSVKEFSMKPSQAQAAWSSANGLVLSGGFGFGQKISLFPEKFADQ